MADLSKLSDEQLDAAILAHGGKPEDLGKISNEQLDNLINSYGPENKSSGLVPDQYKGMVKGALNSLPSAGAIFGGAGGGILGGTAGSIVPGAGTALGASYGAVGGAGLGMGLGESLKNIGEKYLLGEDKTRSDIYGGPVKAAVQGAEYEMGGQALNKGLGAIANSNLGQKALGTVKTGAAKLGEALTGIPEQDIKTFASNADEIQRMAKSSDNSTAEAADQMRQQFQQQIQATKQGLNKQISQALETNQGSVPVDPILEKLVSAKATINPKLYPEQIKEIDGLIGKISSVSGESGQLSASQAHDIKSFLQDYASSAYKNPGIFALGDQSAKAAKAAAAQARLLVNDAAPEVAKANNALSNLHNIEDKMNLNLINPGKPEAALMAAGSGGNTRNIQALEALGQATGSDMLGQAQKLSAMRSFGNPKLLPVDMTGKAAARMLAAGGAGTALGGPIGAAVSVISTSPQALKQAIKTGIFTKDILANPQVQQQMSKPMIDYAQRLFSEQAGPIGRRMEQLKNQGR